MASSDQRFIQTINNLQREIQILQDKSVAQQIEFHDALRLNREDSLVWKTTLERELEVLRIDNYNKDREIRLLKSPHQTSEEGDATSAGSHSTSKHHPKPIDSTSQDFAEEGDPSAAGSDSTSQYSDDGWSTESEDPEDGSHSGGVEEYEEESDGEDPTGVSHSEEVEDERQEDESSNLAIPTDRCIVHPL